MREKVSILLGSEPDSSGSGISLTGRSGLGITTDDLIRSMALASSDASSRRLPDSGIGFMELKEIQLTTSIGLFTLLPEIVPGTGCIRLTSRVDRITLLRISAECKDSSIATRGQAVAVQNSLTH